MGPVQGHQCPYDAPSVAEHFRKTGTVNLNPADVLLFRDSLAHRVREAWKESDPTFTGPIEVDEVYIGGKEKNKHPNKKLHAKGGSVGKTVVVGARDRYTRQVLIDVIPVANTSNLETFISRVSSDDATIYTDDHPGYRNIRYHGVVRHSSGEYVNGDVHTNSIESVWAVLKRGIYGTYHHISPISTLLDTLRKSQAGSIGVCWGLCRRWRF